MRPLKRTTRTREERNYQRQRRAQHNRQSWQRDLRRARLNFWLIMVVIVLTVLLLFAYAAEPEPLEYIHLETETPLAEEPTVRAVESVLDKPAQEPVTYADTFRRDGNLIEDCMLTFYCCEPYAHICGTGDGLTATGTPITAYWTCAVDPTVIPYGADIMVEYQDGTVQYWKAQDCGGSVKGNHLDLAVSSHDEALLLGVQHATVYWKEASQ